MLYISRNFVSIQTWTAWVLSAGQHIKSSRLMHCLQGWILWLESFWWWYLVIWPINKDKMTCHCKNKMAYKTELTTRSLISKSCDKLQSVYTWIQLMLATHSIPILYIITKNNTLLKTIKGTPKGLILYLVLWAYIYNFVASMAHVTNIQRPKAWGEHLFACWLANRKIFLTVLSSSWMTVFTTCLNMDQDYWLGCCQSAISVSLCKKERYF